LNAPTFDDPPLSYNFHAAAVEPKIWRIRGRRVAREMAAMPRPGSTVDQITTGTVTPVIVSMKKILKEGCKDDIHRKSVELARVIT
jgi:hypothetical protein